MIELGIARLYHPKGVELDELRVIPKMLPEHCTAHEGGEVRQFLTRQVRTETVHDVVDLEFCEPCKAWHLPGDHGECEIPEIPAEVIPEEEVAIEANATKK